MMLPSSSQCTIRDHSLRLMFGTRSDVTNAGQVDCDADRRKVDASLSTLDLLPSLCVQSGDDRLLVTVEAGEAVTACKGRHQLSKSTTKALPAVPAPDALQPS